MDELTDHAFNQLLDAAQRGDGSGYDGLVRLIERRLVGFLRARGAHDPDGLANDVMVRMCRSIGTFSGNQTQFRAWVFTIARNRVIDEHRWRSRRPDAEPVDPTSMPETRTEPEVSRHDQRERVEAMLASLTDVQREVMILRIVAGLSVDETAEVMGKRRGAIRALQHRATQQLRVTLVDGP